MYYLKTKSIFTDTPVYQKLDGGEDTFFFSDARVAKDYAMTGLYEQSLIQWTCESLLPPGKDVLDIGAHSGIYAVDMAKKAHVHAFECSPKSFNYLCANIALRNLHSAVTPYRVALGNRTGETLYYVRDSGDGGGNGIVPFDYDRHRNTPTVSVPVRTLDSFHLSNIGFIKLDVEGAEQQVLEGAVDTLRQNGYPKILFESWRPGHETTGVPSAALRTSLFAFIESLGYRCIPVQGWDEMFIAEHV